MAEPIPSENWEKIVQQHVASLRFGVVQIVVHEGSVVQVERTEKVRIPVPPTKNFGNNTYQTSGG